MVRKPVVSTISSGGYLQGSVRGRLPSLGGKEPPGPEKVELERVVRPLRKKEERSPITMPGTEVDTKYMLSFSLLSS